jgi:hypothetical protein
LKPAKTKSFRVKIITPKGMARKSEKNMRSYLVHGWVKKKKYKTEFVDEETFIWTLYPEDDKERLKMIKGLAQYDAAIKASMKKLKRLLNKEDRKALEDWLINKTTIEVLED